MYMRARRARYCGCVCLEGVAIGAVAAGGRGSWRSWRCGGAAVRRCGGASPHPPHAHRMRNLEIERVVLAAMGVGIARRCLEVRSLLNPM